MRCSSLRGSSRRATLRGYSVQFVSQYPDIVRPAAAAVAAAPAAVTAAAAAVAAAPAAVAGAPAAVAAAPVTPVAAGKRPRLVEREAQPTAGAVPSAAKAPRKAQRGRKEPKAGAAAAPSKNSQVAAATAGGVGDEPRDPAERLRRAQLALHGSAPVAELCHRDAEAGAVDAFLQEALRGGRRGGGALYVCGAPGTGKSLTVGRAAAAAAEAAAAAGKPMCTLEARGTTFPEPSRLFPQLAARLDLLGRGESEASLPPREALARLQKRLAPKKAPRQPRPVLLTVDEVDHLQVGSSQCNRSTGASLRPPACRVAPTRRRAAAAAAREAGARCGSHESRRHHHSMRASLKAGPPFEVLVALFGMAAAAHSQLTLIGIANTIELPARALATLRQEGSEPATVVFRAYEANALVAIVSHRLGGVMEPRAVQLACRKIAANNGDVRRALDLCRTAIDAALQEPPFPQGGGGGGGAVAPAAMADAASAAAAADGAPPPPLVTIKVMMQALRTTGLAGGRYGPAIEKLPQGAAIALCVAAALAHKHARSCTAGELQDGIISHQGRRQAGGGSACGDEFEDTLDRLVNAGLVTRAAAGGGGGGGGGGAGAGRQRVLRVSVELEDLKESLGEKPYYSSVLQKI